MKETRCQMMTTTGTAVPRLPDGQNARDGEGVREHRSRGSCYTVDQWLGRFYDPENYPGGGRCALLRLATTQEIGAEDAISSFGGKDGVGSIGGWGCRYEVVGFADDFAEAMRRAFERCDPRDGLLPYVPMLLSPPYDVSVRARSDMRAMSRANGIP